MKSKFILAFLTIIFVIGTICTPALASSTDSKVTLESIKSITDQSEYLEIVDLGELPENTPFIEFDSLEEFEKAVKDLEKENKQQETVLAIDANASDETILENETPKNSLLATTSTRLTVITKLSWNPIKQQTQPGSITVDLGYTYTGSGSKKKFSKITKVKSYSLGFPTDWRQTTYKKSFTSTKKTVKMTIFGYNLLGVSIGGQPIGFKVNDTYKFNYTIGGKTSLISS